MQRFLIFALVAIFLLGLAIWWFMPLKVERKILGNVAPNFQSWFATDLDNDKNPEILLSYANKPPVLVRIQSDKFETTTLLGVDRVVLPSPDYPQQLLLPLAKCVPAKAKGQFWLMRLEKGLPSLSPFPKVERPDYVVWLDADNDGKANDLIVRSGKRRFWFIMDESGDWKFKAQLPSGPKRILIGIADFDKDGRPDLIMGGRNYSVLWGNGKAETNLGSDAELAKVQIADLDNNGRKEILALKREGSFARLVVWEFDGSQKRLVASASQQFERYVAVIGSRIRFPSGTIFPLERSNLWVADLGSDGLKEVIAYTGDELFNDILYVFVIQAQLRIWSSSRGTTPVIMMPSPSPPARPKVSFTTPPWLLIALDGKQIEPKEIETMKEAQQPVSCFRLGKQSFVLTTQWKYVQRFYPRFHSLNPLVLTWWDEGIVKHGTLWRVSEIAGAKSIRCKKVLDLPGSPQLAADFNGDGSSEIFWVRNFQGTYDEPLIFGVTAWKLCRWRKAAWVLAGQRQNPQITLVPSSPTSSIISALSILTTHQSSSTRQIRLLPIKTDKGFDLLVSLFDGTIEQVRVR